MLLSVLYLALITGLGSVNHPAPGHSSHCHWSLHWSTPLISDHSRPSSTLQTLCVLWQLKFLKFVNIRRNVTVWLFMTLLLSYCCIMVTVVSSCSGLQCPLQCPPLNMQMMSDNPGHSATQQGYCRQDSSHAYFAGKNNLLSSLSALACADPSHYFAGKYL